MGILDYKGKIDLPVRIRQSSLEKAECLYAWHRSVSEPSSMAARFGTTFHDAAARYIGYLLATKQTTDYEEGTRIAESLGSVQSLFVDWVHSNFWDVSSIVGIEWDLVLNWEFDVVDPDTPFNDSPFSGRLDLVQIDGLKATVVDFKTHAGIFSPDTLQSQYYPWLVWRAMPGIEEIEFRLDFVRHNTSRSALYRAEDMIDVERSILQRVERLFEAIQNGTKTPARCNHCTYCVLDCPLVETGLSKQLVGALRTKDEAKEAAQYWDALKQAASRIEAKLKAFTMENEPVPFSANKSVGYKTFPRVVYNPKTILRLNSEHGLPLEKGLKVSNPDLRKVFKDDLSYAAQAESDAKKTMVSRFGVISSTETEEEDERDSE